VTVAAQDLDQLSHYLLDHLGVVPTCSIRVPGCNPAHTPKAGPWRLDRAVRAKPALDGRERCGRTIIRPPNSEGQHRARESMLTGLAGGRQASYAELAELAGSARPVLAPGSRLLPSSGVIPRTDMSAATSGCRSRSTCGPRTGRGAGRLRASIEPIPAGRLCATGDRCPSLVLVSGTHRRRGAPPGAGDSREITPG